MSHTKGEWKIQESQVEAFAIVIGTDDTYNICQANCLLTFEEELKEWEANAQRIVHCVNSHDDLLEACEMMQRWHVGDKWRDSKTREEAKAWDETSCKLQQAISKASRDALKGRQNETQRK